jgi:hypothetical protein
MAECFILDDMPFEIDLDQLRTRLHLEQESPYVEEIESLVRDAQAVARPKALHKIAFIESRGDDHVVIDNVLFTSRVLRVNLDPAHRVFAYMATCGVELEDWAHSFDDVLHRYWADTILVLALHAATKVLNEDLADRYRLGRTATMSPGRLADWPLSQQGALFALLGDPREAIGVRLTSSYLMVPTKSVSGIRFPTEQSFESCQLCPREHCPSRRAPYDSSLYDRRYRANS